MASVYLYVLDTLRADHAACGIGNSGLSITPHIDALAADGVCFSNAVAQATWTRLSAPSILTGIHPVALGMYPRALGRHLEWSKAALPSGVETMATLFKQQGFRTASYSAHPLLVSRMGLERGFDEAPDMYTEPTVKPRIELALQLSEKLGRKRKLPAFVTGQDLHAARRKRQPDTAADHFTLLWSMDTHAPLFDRDRIDELTLDDPELINTFGSVKENLSLAKDLYSRMVAYADRQVGELVGELKERGEYEESLIIVTSDHGEGFGENETYGHGGLPYESQIHVPMIIKFPGGEFSRSVYPELVGLIDLLPTVMDWYGIPVGTPIHGRSLLPLLRSEAPGDEYQVIHCPTLDKEWDCICVRTKSWKYLFSLHLGPKLIPWRHRIKMIRYYLTSSVARRQFKVLRNLGENPFTPFKEEVFDLELDPYEEHNLIATTQGHELAQRAREIFSDHNRQMKAYFRDHIASFEAAEMDEVVLKRLTDLGYLE